MTPSMDALTTLWRDAQLPAEALACIALPGADPGLGRVADGFAVARPPFEPCLEASDSGFGRLVALRHAALFSATPARWPLPSMPPGSHSPEWMS